MNHKKTDRIIKDKTERYSMDAPMHLFDGIANALENEPIVEPVKKSGRRGYWLLSLLIFTIAGSLILWNVSSSSTEQTVLTTEQNEKSVLNNDENSELSTIKTGQLADEENTDEIASQNGNHSASDEATIEASVLNFESDNSADSGVKTSIENGSTNATISSNVNSKTNALPKTEIEIDLLKTEMTEKGASNIDENADEVSVIQHSNPIANSPASAKLLFEKNNSAENF